MSMMLMYWLVKFDDIRAVSLTVAVVFLIAAGMGWAVLTDEVVEKSVEKSKELLRLTKIFAAVFLMGIATWTFLPSTKQMAAIVLVPAVLNNKDVQEIGAKTADLGKDLLALTQAYVKEHLSNVDYKKGIKDSD